MDADEVFLGPEHKFLKKKNLFKYQGTGDNDQKCNVDEVDRLLSLQRDLLKQPHYEKCVSLSEAEWDEDLKLAKVTKTAKNLTKNFSHSRDKSIYLYPEECLCLLEMKCLILRWNERKLTIKNAFALLLQAGSGCTFAQFRTYSYLVKSGFRVFKYDNKLKNSNYHPSDLTKVIEKNKKEKNIPKNVKKIENIPKNAKKIENIVRTPRNKDIFPKLESTGRVILSTPSSRYLPHNLQPNYNTYSFNITVSPESTNITEVIPVFETTNIKKELFFSNENIIYDSPQPTGNYPVYEKNIFKTVKFDDIIYEPQIKKLKQVETEENSLPITINMPPSNLSDERNLCSSKYGENMEIEENSLTVTNNEATSASTSTSGNENKLYASNYEDSSSVNKVQKYIKDEKTMANLTLNLNLSCTIINCSNSELETTLSNSILEDEMINMKLNLPSHIKQKLFAIKPSLERKESVEKVNNVHYDVYYPDNHVPKSSRPAPDYRVIVFEDHVNSFPNIYNIINSYPNDNVPTLWAIANSSSVSFYNVDRIILPKPTDWK